MEEEFTYLLWGQKFGMVGYDEWDVSSWRYRPYNGTFLVFMDYARNAVRLSAMMQLPNIYVFTHDSIGLGEDRLSHQLIEHLVNLRSTPNLYNWRPADLTEVARCLEECDRLRFPNLFDS